MKKKLLTVGIPNYNGGENLKRAILSCKNLGLKEDEYEILVVDNCSTDNSVEIVKELKKEMKNIRLIINDKNYGRIGNWNRIIEFAEGKYLIYLFSNDEIYSNYIIRDNLNILENDFSVGLINTKYYIENNGRFLKKKGNIKCNKKVSTEKYMKDIVENIKPGISPLQTLILRTDFLKKIKFKEEFPIYTDQITIFEYMKEFGYIYISNSYQIVWHANENRFHFKKMESNIRSKIEEDIKGINYIKKLYPQINKNKYYYNYFLKLLKDEKISINTRFFIKKVGFTSIIKGFNLYFIIRIFEY